MFLVAALLAAAARVEGQGGGWPPAISDNSFLVEEAYNQEPGTVQWILQPQYVRGGNFWAISFTNEWPVPRRQKHQLSYTALYSTAGDRTDAGWGDVALNYRYQALDGGERGWWFAPRLTTFLPTGNWRKGLGNGVPGLQVEAPFSRRVTRDLAVHLNAGATVYPEARAFAAPAVESRATAWGLSEGASVIWLAAPQLNFLVEVVASQFRLPAAGDTTVQVNVAIVNPGVRRAFNFAKGQLVLGAGIPIGLTRSSPDPGLLFYLSVGSAGLETPPLKFAPRPVRCSVRRRPTSSPDYA